MTKARDLANAANALDDVSATELGYLDGVTSAIQTQIDAKQAVVSGVNDTELGYLDGVTSAIQTQLDAKTAKSTLTTTGDIYYASAANTPARLGIGSTGNVLTVASGIPSWAAPAAGGKVLQVVSTTTSTDTSTTSTSYTDATNLTATITPSSTNSKILILMSIGVDCITAGLTDNGVKGQIVRASTNIWTTDYFYGRNASTGNRQSASIVYLDSPASTSALTYKFQFARFGGTATAVINYNGGYSTITLLEIGA